MAKKKRPPEKKQGPGVWFRKYRLYAGAALVLALAGALTFYLTRPRILWYVDEEYTASWNRILRQGSPPRARHEALPRTGNPPPGRYGYIITRRGPAGEAAEGASVRLYRDLSRTLEYQGCTALALDPWMILRRHQSPVYGRDRKMSARQRKQGTAPP